MRAWRHAHAFEEAELVVAVLPVTSDTSQLWWKPPGLPLEDSVCRRLDRSLLTPGRAELTSLLSAPAWRARLSSLEPPPRVLEAAPPAAAPGLADGIERSFSFRPDAMVVFRSYLAPLGLALAEHFGCSHTVLDLDDDDASVLEGIGSGEGPAFDRVVATMAPEYRFVALASRSEADSLAARLGLGPFEVVPNGVEVPPRPLSYPKGSRTVSMVANFTYEPNARGAAFLRDEVWPRLERLIDEPCSLRFVGPGVGTVDDLEPVYRSSAVMAVPLFEGGGTRLKVLEAWALGRPVVSTTVGVAGLEVEPGREALAADDPQSFAEALASVLDDPSLARRLVKEGRKAVRAYTAERAEAALRDLAMPLPARAPGFAP